MYITLDVKFHEDTMYFSSESKLQGGIKRKFPLLTMKTFLKMKLYVSPKKENFELVNEDHVGVDVDKTNIGNLDVSIEVNDFESNT